MAVVLLHALRNVSFTDKTCVWSRPTESKINSTISDLYPDKYDSSVLNREVLDSDRTWFFNELLKSNPSSGFCFLLAPEPVVQAVCNVKYSVKSMCELQDVVCLPTAEKIVRVLDEMVLSEHNVSEVERLTRGQRTNSMWGIVRAGRLTASNIGSVIKIKGGKPNKSLTKSLLGEYNASGARPVQWGVLNEDRAIKEYEQFSCVTVTRSGLWLHESGCFGASPDGLIGNDCVLEIKCPYVCRASDISSHLHDKKFFLSQDLVTGDIRLNTSCDQGHKYYHQVQSCMWLTKRSACQFVVWCPTEMVIVPVQFESQYESKYLNMLQSFYKLHFLPSVLYGCDE